MLNKDFLTISEAAQQLGVSLNTLRRWDKSGKLPATKKAAGSHRYYTPQDLMMVTGSEYRMAHQWVTLGSKIPSAKYCPTRDIFEGRLISMQQRLIQIMGIEASLIIVMAGEIGNNSFDHNLGQWPDLPGIYFADDQDRGMIILADRGIGLLATLRRVRPALRNEQEAVQLAFTETISGRAPENRGNGLKLVRQVIAENQFNLFFQSGNATLRLVGGSPDLHLATTPRAIHGCLALIEYSHHQP